MNKSEPTLDITNLVRPLNNQGPYLRPFVGDILHEKYETFLVGINPATAVCSADHEEVSDVRKFAKLIQDKKEFYRVYEEIREKKGKSGKSKTRKANEKVMNKLKEITGKNVLGTNVIPYPTRNQKELNKIGRPAINEARSRFTEMLLYQKPKTIVLYGKKTFDHFMKIVDDKQFTIVCEVDRTMPAVELVKQIPLFCFKYTVDGPTTTVFYTRHLMYYGDKSPYFQDFFKKFEGHVKQ